MNAIYIRMFFNHSFLLHTSVRIMKELFLVIVCESMKRSCWCTRLTKSEFEFCRCSTNQWKQLHTCKYVLCVLLTRYEKRTMKYFREVLKVVARSKIANLPIRQLYKKPRNSKKSYTATHTDSITTKNNDDKNLIFSFAVSILLLVQFINNIWIWTKNTTKLPSPPCQMKKGLPQWKKR